MIYDDITLDLKDDLVNNPTARVPVALVLDTSGSMSGTPISELNEGVKLFFDAIRADEIASDAAEIAVITFGGESEIIRDFARAEFLTVPVLTAGGGTPMGEAVNMALDLLEERKEQYKNNGVDYYQPWMVLMTDGKPTDDIELAANRTSRLINEKKLTIFPIGIGPNADMNTLSRFSPRRPPVRLKGLNFKAFFEWLSKSVAVVSRSNPGETVRLDPPTDWADPWTQV